MKNEVKNGLIISVVVILIIALVYFMTAVFMTGEIGNKSNSDKKTTTASNNASSEYDNMIMAGRIFNQAEETYMVIIFSNNDAKEDLKTAISGYQGDNKLYVVDIDQAVNAYVKAEEDNTNPTSSKNLKVKNNALITISNGVVSSYINSDNQIINALK